MSDTHDWTPVIIDRLNEFARENSDEFHEIKTGHEAADMIVRMHGRYNELKADLREAQFEIRNLDADSPFGGCW